MRTLSKTSPCAPPILKKCSWYCVQPSTCSDTFNFQVFIIQLFEHLIRHAKNKNFLTRSSCIEIPNQNEIIMLTNLFDIFFKHRISSRAFDWGVWRGAMWEMAINKAKVTLSFHSKPKYTCSELAHLYELLEGQDVVFPFKTKVYMQ